MCEAAPTIHTNSTTAAELLPTPASSAASAEALVRNDVNSLEVALRRVADATFRIDNLTRQHGGDVFNAHSK